MAESDAARQRRYRRHKQNDHSLCVEGRCDAVTPGVTRDVAECPGDADQPLGVAGQVLWDTVTVEVTLGPLQKVLLLEACRITDRLTQLDGQLRGRGEWLRLKADEDRDEVVVVVDRALSEARQQATALKALVAELWQTSSSAKPTGKQAPPPQASTSTAGEGKANVRDIRSRLAAKRSATSH